MQIGRGGVIRWAAGEALLPPFNQLADAAFVMEGGIRYFASSPFTQPPLAGYFGFAPRPTLGPPADFLEVYGTRPVSESDVTTWLQQLGLWAGKGLPDGITVEQAAIATAVFAAYGLGRLVPFRLTNGASLVALPDADSRAANTGENLLGRVIYDAGLIYGGGRSAQYVIGAYQGSLRDQGVAVENLVPWLVGGGGHQG